MPRNEVACFEPTSDIKPVPIPCASIARSPSTRCSPRESGGFSLPREAAAPAGRAGQHRAGAAANGTRPAAADQQFASIWPWQGLGAARGLCCVRWRSRALARGEAAACVNRG